MSVSNPLTSEYAGDLIAGLESEIAKVIVGQHLLVRRLLTGLFAAIPFATKRDQVHSGCGHILLEGVPGVAKTLTATTLARAISKNSLSVGPGHSAVTLIPNRATSAASPSAKKRSKTFVAA